jgi:DNA-binding response OmpR family regulator
MSPNFISTVAEALEAGDIEREPRRPIVMIVDDEQVIADTLSAIFMQNGYTVLTAYDGRSALETAKVIPPELLISDVMMPQMNGIDLAIAIRNAAPDCKVLLFSGQAATVDLLAEARSMGHDFFTLLKPVHPTEMLAKAAECLMGRRREVDHVQLVAD